MDKFIIDLNEFRQIKLLGKGSFGDVRLIEDKSTPKKYAAKTLYQQLIKKQNQVSFFNEIQALISAKNPAFPAFLGFNLYTFNNDPYPTIIMEYLPNGNLFDLLEKCRENCSPKEWNDTKRYINLLGIAIGMRYLHSNNIVHRDLKSTNILLDENLYPRISDFGTSKRFDGVNLMETFIGSLAYMAPEILTSQPYDSKVDVYSFGLVAYEIITSNKPFSDKDTQKTIMRDVPKGKRPDVSMITDKNLVSFLENCWSNDPDQRPTFVQIVDILKNEFLLNYFSIDIDEVNNYLKRFPDEEPIYDFEHSNDIPFYKVVVLNFENTKNPISILDNDRCSRENVLTSSGACTLDVFEYIDSRDFLLDIIGNTFRCRNASVLSYDDNFDENSLIDGDRFVREASVDFDPKLNYVAYVNNNESSTIPQKIRDFADQKGYCLFHISTQNRDSIKKMYKKIALDLINKSVIKEPEPEPVTDKKKCLIY